MLLVLLHVPNWRRTRQGDGLLLYMDDGGYYDFLEMKIVKGELFVRYIQAAGEGRASHQVQAAFRRRAFLQVYQQLFIRKLYVKYKQIAKGQLAEIELQIRYTRLVQSEL
jgi:hypothetical protein